MFMLVLLFQQVNLLLWSFILYVPFLLAFRGHTVWTSTTVHYGEMPHADKDKQALMQTSPSQTAPSHILHCFDISDLLILLTRHLARFISARLWVLHDIRLLSFGAFWVGFSQRVIVASGFRGWTRFLFHASSRCLLTQHIRSALTGVFESTQNSFLLSWIQLTQILSEGHSVFLRRETKSPKNDSFHLYQSHSWH